MDDGQGPEKPRRQMDASGPAFGNAADRAARGQDFGQIVRRGVASGLDIDIPSVRLGVAADAVEPKALDWFFQIEIKAENRLLHVVARASCRWRHGFAR